MGIRLGRLRRRQLMILLGIVLLSVVAYGVRWRLTPTHTYPDTYQYLSMSFDIAGKSETEARTLAAFDVCRILQPETDLERCVQTRLAIPERFRDIFESRIGYPAVSAPLVAVFGPPGLTFAAALLGVAWAVVFALALRESGGSTITMGVGILLIFTLPIGAWAIAKLAEGAAYLGITGILLGALMVMKGDMRYGLGVMLGFVAWLALAKPSSAVALGLVLFALSLLSALFTRQRSTRRSASIIAGVGLFTAVGVMGVLRLLGQPGLNETLQDLYTMHFRSPDIADPLGRLLSDLPIFLEYQWGLLWASPLPMISLLVALAAIYWMARRFGRLPLPTMLLWAAVGLTGIPLILVHPVNTEVPRLMATIWMPYAAGFAAVLTGALGDSPQRRDEPSGDIVDDERGAE